MNKLICLVFALLSQIVHAEPDTNYVRDLRYYANLSLSFEQKANHLTLTNSRGKVLLLSTNSPFPEMGILFSHNWLNVSFHAPLGRMTYSDSRRGETENFGLSLGYTGNRWWFRSFYESYKGYHLVNPSSYYANWFHEFEQFPILPNLQAKTFYANVYYGFNHKKYSHRAMIWQSTVQKKSAGSMIAGVSLGYDNIFSDSVIIPSIARSEFLAMNQVHQLEAYTMGLNFGYTYNFVFSKHWSLGTMAVPGFAATFNQAWELDDQLLRKGLEVGLMLEARGMLSYHHERWFAGLQANIYGLFRPFRTESLNNMHTNIRLNFGYRFHTPKSRRLRRLGL